MQVKNISAEGVKVVPLDGNKLPGDANILIANDWKESKELREKNPEKFVFNAGDLIVPAQDAEGKIWTAQVIQEGGSKLFVKDGQKEGNFSIVGGDQGGLEAASAVIIAEGYATANSLSKAIDGPIVAAFDSGNLALVAKELKDKFPDKPIIIAGDDDVHHQFTIGGNKGKEKALEAAELVGGKAIFPVFAPGENSWPKDVATITVTDYKKGNIDDKQTTALDNMKKFIDFNDLELSSSLGKEGVKRQVVAAVKFELDKSRKQLSKSEDRKIENVNVVKKERKTKVSR